MKMVGRVLFTLLFALPFGGAFGAEPDRRGEAVIRAEPPRYQGEGPNVHIPPHLHFHNEGGSDGAGLCVICSVIINGRVQGVPGLEGGKQSRLWRTAKGRPGGYSPDKLADLVREVMPGERFASYVGRDTSVLERLSEAGYPIAATMNTGQLYGYRPIHHMVSLASYKRGGTAWVVDNNRPGFYSVMPSEEWDRRWIDGGTGWAWVWTRRKILAGLGPVVVMVALAFVLVFVGARRRASED